MHSFTFVHAADLHLGAPLKGLDSSADAVFPLQEASFAALANLEALCLEKKAAFLILAGDVYDDKDGVLRARFALRDMFVRLGKAGVRVFFAHGNHDPYKAGRLPVPWPENVTVFSPEVSCECVMREGEAIALVQGVSHASAAETANLSKRFTAYAPGVFSGPFAGMEAQTLAAVSPGIFQIAVLHCAVGGAGEGHAPYAPCSLTDLTGTGFDYWALGHVHQGGTLSAEPPVVYPGSLQGLHVNETGERGAVVVTVTEGRATVETAPLAPVLWRKIFVDVTDAETLDAMEAAVTAALETEAAAAESVPRVRALFCRVILRGRTELDSLLRRRAERSSLLERVRAGFSTPLPVWVKDIAAQTRPLREETSLADRSDLVGEVSRIAADGPLLADIIAKAASPVRNHQRLKKILAAREGFAAREEEAASLAEDAKILLVSLLEGE